MSQLPVVMSNKTTALRRPTLHWDFVAHTDFFSLSLSLCCAVAAVVLRNLKISCQKVYCLVFRMRLSLHIFMIDGDTFSDPFFCACSPDFSVGASLPRVCMFAYADNH